MLAESHGPLADGYQALLLDLDGTLYRGDVALPGVVEVLSALRGTGTRLVYVTNNASRTPQQVVEHLAGVGVVADPGSVLTSAQAGARVVATLVPDGSRALVVGGEGLVEAVRAAGLEPVGRADQEPAAVVQGWWPGLDWAQLAEGAYVLARGVPWVATNVDATLPTAQGIAPGNGSFVQLLAAVTGRRPDAVGGKPGPVLLQLAADGQHALVVGDRLDTDIEGAVAAGLDSLLVLSGVTTVPELLSAGPASRPTYVCRRLVGLQEPHPAPQARGERRWGCGSAEVTVREGRLVSVSPDEPAHPDDLLRAACLAAWQLADAGAPADVDPGLLALLDG